jgi:hypothetical protein
MTESDVRTYSGLRPLRAALALLDVEDDPVARAALRIQPVERRGSSGCGPRMRSIDWMRLTHARGSSTTIPAHGVRAVDARRDAR